MKTIFKLKEGEHLNRSPNKPVIIANHGYLWVGNDAPEDKMCFAHLSGRKILLGLATAIHREAMKNRPRLPSTQTKKRKTT